MIDSHNMTHAEHFRLNGSLSERRCLELVATAERMSNVPGALVHINEGSGCFPSEDFLDGVISRLLTATKKSSVKADYVEAVKWCVKELENIQTETRQRTEYGFDELCKASNALEFA